MNGGKNARAEAARTIRSGEQGTRNCSADNMYFANSTDQGAFRCFQLQNHSAGYFVPANEVFYFAASNFAKTLPAVEDACHICEKNQTVGLDEFGSRCGHVIGVDVIEFAVGAEAEAGSDWNDLGTPERTQKIDIYFRQVANESKTSFTLADLHGLGQEARAIGGADADSGLPGLGNSSGETLC